MIQLPPSQLELDLSEDLQALIQDLVARFGIEEIVLMPLPEKDEDEPR